MDNFFELLKDILNERNKTFKDLEDNGIISKKSFYQFKEYTPFLPTVVDIANFLNISLDYFADRVSVNNFRKYKVSPIIFYPNFIKILKDSKITKSKLAKDIKIGRANFTYWKQGSLPKFITLIDISNYLKCNIDDLLTTENKNDF